MNTYRPVRTVLFLAVALLMVACDSSPTPEPGALEFSTEPSGELENIIEDTPSDFTWDFYNDNVAVSLQEGPDWDGELVLAGFQIQNGEVVHRTTTDPVDTNVEVLSGGASIGDLISGSSWMSGSDWVSVSNWRPSSSWSPGSSWSPSEIEEEALAEAESMLEDNQTMVVVYAHRANESGDYGEVTRPFGLIFQKQNKIGNQIAFDANLSDSNEIFVVNPDGTNAKRITNNGTYDAHPMISPDGTQIAFHSSRNNGSRGEDVDLFVMDADGSNVQEVTKLSTYYGYFDWSPDGKKLVYGDAPNGTDNLYVINVDGTGKTQLTSNSGTDVEPHWSPDGSRIVFASDRDGDYDLYTVDPNGNNLQRITDDQYDNQQPRWSPDGSKIAFMSDRGGGWNRVYTIEVKTGTITQVTGGNSSNDSADRWPSWSPDGSEIAFGSTAFNGVGSEIYRVPSDGSGTPEKVTDSFDDNARRPFWSPVE